MRPENEIEKQEKKIEKLVPQLRYKARTETHNRVLGDIMEIFEESNTTKSAAYGPNIWRIIMQVRIFKYVAVVVIILVVITGAYMFVGTPSGSGVVWADVTKKVEKSQSFKYRLWRSATSGPKKEGFEFISEKYQIIRHSFEKGTRSDLYENNELVNSTYSLLQEKEEIMIFYHGQYSRSANDGAGRRYIDPRVLVDYIKSGKYTELGRSNIYGVEVEGIELKGQKISGEALEKATTRLWVGVESGWPVQIEQEGLQYYTDYQVVIIHDQFEWDIDFEPGTFEPVIPEDFKLMKTTAVSSSPKPKRTWEKPVEIEDPDFAYLEELGLVEEEVDKSNIPILLESTDQIWQTQDEFMRTWPAYSAARELLSTELKEKIEPEFLSNEELVRMGILLREKFWEAGGCLSENSYRYGYMARILLEMAHEREPDNMAITDELVEAIQTTQTGVYYDKDTQKFVRTPILSNLLIDLRREQFEQILQEIGQGRKPVWDDFVRVCELATIAARLDNEHQLATEAVAWVIRYADQGGWTGYMEILTKLQSQIEKGSTFGFAIYQARRPGFPEAARYFRRFPSFKGPTPQKRGVVPIYSIDPNTITIETSTGTMIKTGVFTGVFTVTIKKEIK